MSNLASSIRLSSSLPRHLAVSALVLLGFLALGCDSKRPPERANILLITIDTLRADHLSAWGYPRQTSPVLDRLASEGLRFDQAIVQWPKTGPSFASMMTSTYPKNNKIVRKIGIRLPDEFRLLSEVLKGEGYSTHAVVANGAVGREFNFDQGFDTYVETWKLPPAEDGLDHNIAAGVNRQVYKVLEGIDREKPFFLWVHYLDPHFPYTPPEAFEDRFQDDEWFDPEAKIEIDVDRPRRELLGIGFQQMLDGRNDLAFYRARYDAEIAYNDEQIGELLEEVGRRGMLDETLTVVTSDHGESLGEHHYYFDHGRFAFQTCLRVPLILHAPGWVEPAVDPDPVELIHLAPTLLQAAGVQLDGDRWMEGRSLWPRIRGEAETGERPYAFSEAGYGRLRMWQRVALDDRFKLVDAQEGGAQRWITFEVGQRYALFDLDKDPGETENVFEKFPEDARRLRRVMARWYQKGFEPNVDAPGEAGEAEEMDEETREQLKALGYLQ